MAKVIVNQIDRRQYQSNEEYNLAHQAQFEAAFKKFKKEVIKEGILKENRDRMYYVSKAEKERIKKKNGRRKQLKKMCQEKRYDNEYDY